MEIQKSLQDKFEKIYQSCIKPKKYKEIKSQEELAKCIVRRIIKKMIIYGIKEDEKSEFDTMFQIIPTLLNRDRNSEKNLVHLFPDFRSKEYNDEVDKFIDLANEKLNNFLESE